MIIDFPKKNCRHPERRVKALRERNKDGEHEVKCFDCGEKMGVVVRMGLGINVVRKYGKRKALPKN